MVYYQQDSHGRKREPVPTNCPLTSPVTQNKQKEKNQYQTQSLAW